MAQDKIYVCFAVKDRLANIANSLIEKCNDCQQLIWVARSTIQIRHQEKNVKTVCLACVKPTSADKLQPLKAEQLDEILKNL